VRHNRLFRTSVFRLTVLFTTLIAAWVLILFVGSELYASSTLEAGVQATVSARLSGLVGAEPVTTPHLLGAAEASEEQSHGAYILLEDFAGKRLAGNLPQTTPVTGWMRLTVLDNNRVVPVIARGVRLFDGGYLLVGQDASNIPEVRAVIARAFAAGGTATILFGLSAGYVFSRRVLNRLAVVARASQEIMDGDLSRRLPTRGTGDEFDQLINGFNALLDRIAMLVDSVRQVSNDIAHDLRTPLTRLRHRLEDICRFPHTPAEYEQAIHRSIAETSTILDTFAALLRIAQIESATVQDRFEDLDAADIVATTAELYEPLAEERGQTLTIESERAKLRGERELLIQMLANLTDNASRYSPQGARIRIGSALVKDGVRFWVQDDGPGIPEGEREKVFRRFYRLEASRTTPGSGIGLSLAAAIAARHGGRITFSDAAPGLRAEIWLPAAQQRPRNPVSDRPQ
jgi:signal transduction histidine kinase